VEVAGLTHRHELGFGAGYGFDSIAIALLGRTHPLGVVAAALLFGALRSGATAMQFNTQVSGNIISVVQGLVLLFVAADMIIIWLYRLKVRPEGAGLALSKAAVLAETHQAEAAVSDEALETARFTETYPVAVPAAGGFARQEVDAVEQEPQEHREEAK
jgi:hypothetical protein